MRAVHVPVAAVPERLDGPVVVVDVLRAFTTASWVLERGARELVLCATDEDALATKSALGPECLAIRDHELLPGFDVGNSPGRVRELDVAGRPVVQRTANGTVGVHAAAHAPLVLCAALVNASATARFLRASVAASGAEEVVYVITGDGGHADEDLACTELVHALATGGPLPEDPAGRVRRSAAARRLRQGVLAGHPGIHPDDVELAASVDALDAALVAEEAGGRIRVRAVVRA